jgi:hypothetical protein
VRGQEDHSQPEQRHDRARDPREQDELEDVPQHHGRQPEQDGPHRGLIARRIAHERA